MLGNAFFKIPGNASIVAPIFIFKDINKSKLVLEKFTLKRKALKRKALKGAWGVN